MKPKIEQEIAPNRAGEQECSPIRGFGAIRPFAA
jgi:hypothetical protein